MKKFLLLLTLLMVVVISFSITKLETIEFDKDISFTATSVNSILEDYDIEEGKYVGEIDIKLAIRQMGNLGYFSSIDFILNEEQGLLKFLITYNPIIRDYAIEIDGDKLVNKDIIKDSIEVQTGLPLNVNNYKDILKQINNLYSSKGYPYISIDSNLNLSGDNLSLDEYETKDTKYSSDTLVLIIKEYSLWDLKLTDDFQYLDKEEIKNRVQFNFRKDWKDKFFLFRSPKKETYPSNESMQKLIGTLREMPYFSENTTINFEEIDIEDNIGGELLLVIGGEMPKFLDGEKQLDSINIEGNNYIEDFRIRDNLEITDNATISNLDVLKSIDKINQLYKENEYLFTEVQIDYLDKILTFNIKEKKIGNVEITKEATAKTQDYIVDSFVHMKKDDPANSKYLRNTVTAFTGSGFYEDVELLPTSMEEEYVNFSLKPIESTKRGKLMGGINWEMPKEKPWYYGFSGYAEVNMPNPFGYGQTFGINTEINPLKEEYKVGLTYDVIKLFKSDVNLGVGFDYKYTPKGLFNDTLNATVTNQISFNVSPRYQISDFSYITNSVSYDYYNTKDKGDISQGSGSIGYLYNSLDSPYRPYNGEYFSSSVFGAANFENFSNNYYGLNLEGKFFRSFYKFTSGTRLKVGYANDSTANDLFGYLVGGMNSVRTYTSAKRGDTNFLFNTELMYEVAKTPVPIDLFTFFDYGNAENDFTKLLNDPLYSFGAGVKLTVPFLGQLRFEYGWNKELIGGFTFGFGQVF
ncbi:POTRA domain-containing protein [Geotoga petraea]|uniref:Outer membrane protein insertion porin family n=1 Tax=Geotoga petraea TaxID=28234 RepID=A0A1G6IDK3_9BACT|nr:POTRA domain-containing protein [Geotoga petraea]SDC04571.1 outer membrane protein insertion porin family [Geotoga petraea]